MYAPARERVFEANEKGSAGFAFGRCAEEAYLALAFAYVQLSADT